MPDAAGAEGLARGPDATLEVGGNALYAFRLDGGGVALVDAGPDLDGSWTDLESQLRTQLRTRGPVGANVRLVIVTHAHADHAGLAARWAAEGVRVVCGRADLEALRAGGAAYDATRAARAAELIRHGCPEHVLAVIASRPRAALGWVGGADVEAIDDGTALDLDGGGRLRVIAAPGHTPGNLVIAIETSAGDMLCSGDTLLPDVIPTPGLHFPSAVEGGAGGGGARWPSLPPFLGSVRGLGGRETRRILPGHGAPVEGAPASRRVAERFLAHHERRASRVRAALADRPRTAFEVARTLFARLPEDRLGQAMTEVIGHFDLLALSGAGELDEGHGGLLAMRLVDG